MRSDISSAQSQTYRGAKRDITNTLLNLCLMVLGWSLRANNHNQRMLRRLIKSTSMCLHDNHSEYCEFKRTCFQKLSTFLQFFKATTGMYQGECTKSCTICRWYWRKFSGGVKSTMKLNFDGQSHKLIHISTKCKPNTLHFVWFLYD